MSNRALINADGLEVEVRTKVKLTGAQMARLFWYMTDDEQAAFFSTLAEVTESGPALHKQMYAAAEKCDENGRAVMEVIGDMAK